jgi:riboflavin biosynthesis pyrimidine reductase
VHEGPVLVLAESIDPAYEHLLHELGVDVTLATSLHDAMIALAQRGHRSLLVEGGARLAAALIDGHLIDRLVIFQAPIILGGGSLNAFGELPGVRIAEARRLRVVSREAVGDDVMTVFAPDGR